VVGVEPRRVVAAVDERAMCTPIRVIG
jgi:hypothetical protein